MCEEKQSERIDYEVLRYRRGRLVRAGRPRSNAPATRTSYSGWQVYHNGRWFNLHRTASANYIVVR